MKVTLAYAERQLRYFSALVAKLRQTSDASDAKEKTEGKEETPPAPPLGEREGEKKAGGAEGARARRIEKVAAYNAEIGGNIDAEYFVDYYAGRKFPRDWRARLRNWLKTDHATGRLATAAKVMSAPRVFTAADWALCAERCRHCDGKGCVRGLACPPDRDPDWPHTPEECPKFKAR